MKEGDHRNYHTAADLFFALAHIGIHTTSDSAIPEDEVWILNK